MHTCPKCHRPLKNINSWHYCAENDIDSLFEGKKEELILVFDRILAEVGDWEGVHVSATKNCIVFVHNITFLVIRPMKTQLDIKFYLPEPRHDHPIRSCKLWNSKYETHIRLSDPDQVSGVIFKYLRKSFEMS